MANSRGRQLARQNQQPNQPSHAVVAQFASYEGPIPPPEVLAQYNEIAPDTVDRILKMAEKEQDARHYLQKTVIDSGVEQSRRGLNYGFWISIVFGVISGGLTLLGHPEGLVLGGLDIIGLASVFVYQTESRKNERKEKRENNDRQIKPATKK